MKKYEVTFCLVKWGQACDVSRLAGVRGSDAALCGADLAACLRNDWTHCGGRSRGGDCVRWAVCGQEGGVGIFSEMHCWRPRVRCRAL
jgi:hypothetical protein